MKHWKIIGDWNNIKPGDKLQWHNIYSNTTRMVEISSVEGDEIYYAHNGYDNKTAFILGKFTLSRLEETSSTQIYNIWDEHGIWQGAQIFGFVLLSGWTCEIIPESEYPTIPIKDGVYRIENLDGYGKPVVFLEMKNGKWLHANGDTWKYSDNFKILQKYKEDK